CTRTVSDEQVKYVTGMLAHAAEQETSPRGQPAYAEESGAASIAAMINESRLHPAPRAGMAKPIKICLLSGANIDLHIAQSLKTRLGEVENVARQTRELVKHFPAQP